MDSVLSFVPIWTMILAAGIFLYVLLDGFDLGVGILYGFEPDLQSRNLVMNSIAPIWDGNETWLVLGGLALLAAFPLAFAIIIPALYFPVLLMLLALVFRGVAFEFRYRDSEHKSFWDHGFCYGSALAAFAQGVMLGAFIEGFETEGRDFVGSSFDFLSPFSILTGVALVFGYSLLGAGWLILKTEGEVQERARRSGRISLIGVLIGIGAVSLWTPLVSSEIAERWFSWPNLLFLSPVPVLTLRRRLPDVAGAQRRIACRRLHRRDLPVRAVLSRHRHQPVAVDRAAQIHAVGGGVLEQARRPSCWSARCSCCRSSSSTAAGPTGCSAARCAPTSATTEGQCEGAQPRRTVDAGRTYSP